MIIETIAAEVDWERASTDGACAPRPRAIASVQPYETEDTSAVRQQEKDMRE